MFKIVDKIVFVGVMWAMPLFATVSPDNDKTQNNSIENVNIDPNEADFSESTAEFEALFNTNGYDIVDQAMKHIGKPYRSGSAGPYAFDCSGFTSYVYKNMNISLSRSSNTQYKQGVYVKKENVRPGDLVFFSGSRGGRRIGHVGIVSDINADGSFLFVHASTSSGIKVDSSKAAYYSSRYVGAKRILDY